MIVQRSDHVIREDVLRELEWDSRVDDTKIGVSVSDRIVALTGTVGSYAEKVAAETAAHRVSGVLDVANEIVVLAHFKPGKTDADVAHAVRHALEWDVLVPDERIKSTVSDGWVTLEGSVDVLREREDAEEAVRRLAGVRGVRNDITVMPRTVDPAKICASIKEALTRHAEHESRHIGVTAVEGVVTLRGTVGSWAERRAVLGMVSHLPGVRAVSDQLELA